MTDRKPFRTIDQQIELLEQRGMGFIDRDDASRFLMSHNYFSVVNGYKSAFLDMDKTNQDVEVYKPGTDFLFIESLYLFDRALRRQTLGILLDVEDAMRTATVYAFCEKHRGKYDYLDPSSYCQSRNYRSKKDYSKNLIKVLSTLQGITENRPRKPYIGHYIKKHGHVPLWVAAKCLTFGAMSNFYELQQPDVKQKAAGYLSETTGLHIKPKQLVGAYKVLSGFRNICAHEERLYCARVGKNDENAFRELMSNLALVADADGMSAYSSGVLRGIEILSSPPLPKHIASDAMAAMNVDLEFVRSFIAE